MKNEVRAELERQGRTQKWLADQSGVNPTQVNRVCNGLGCRFPTAHKMATALGKTLDELFPANDEAA